MQPDPRETAEKGETLFLWFAQSVCLDPWPGAVLLGARYPMRPKRGAVRALSLSEGTHPGPVQMWNLDLCLPRLPFSPQFPASLLPSLPPSLCPACIRTPLVLRDLVMVDEAPHSNVTSFQRDQLHLQ